MYFIKFVEAISDTFNKLDQYMLPKTIQSRRRINQENSFCRSKQIKGSNERKGIRGAFPSPSRINLLTF